MKQLVLTILLALYALTTNVGVVSAQSRNASLEFQPKEIIVRPSDIFKTQIIVDTAGVGAAGVGAQIVYDKFVLEVLDVTPSTIFADYPVAAFDNDKGLLHISGIVSGPGETFLGRASLATVTWKLLKPESTSAFFEHKVGDTTDSNIAVSTGNGDILSVTGQLIVTPGDETVVPPTEALGDDEIAEITLSEDGESQGFLSRVWLELKLFTNNLFKRFRYKTSSIQGEPAVDPYAPIGSLQAKTSLDTEQETGSETRPNLIASELNTRGQPNLLIYIGVGFLLAVIAFFIWRRLSRRVEPSPYRPPEIPQTPQTFTASPPPPVQPVSPVQPVQPIQPTPFAPQMPQMPPTQPVQPIQPVSQTPQVPQPPLQ